ADHFAVALELFPIAFALAVEESLKITPLVLRELEVYDPARSVAVHEAAIEHDVHQLTVDGRGQRVFCASVLVARIEQPLVGRIGERAPQRRLNQCGRRIDVGRGDASVGELRSKPWPQAANALLVPSRRALSPNLAKEAMPDDAHAARRLVRPI